jgi:hypothetical protein
MTHDELLLEVGRLQGERAAIFADRDRLRERLKTYRSRVADLKAASVGSDIEIHVGEPDPDDVA